MDVRNLQFCFYYKGEEECPYDRKFPDYDNDAGFAWNSASPMPKRTLSGITPYTRS